MTSQNAHAQNIELKRSLLRTPNLSLQYTNYENGLVGYQINAGSPPIFWGQNRKNFFVLNLSYAETQLATITLPERVNFNRFSLVPIYRHQLNKDWSFSTVIPFSFAQDEYEGSLNSRALAMVGVATWTKNLTPSGTNYGVGLVMIKLAQRFLVVPNFAYQYISKDYDWAFRFGFPRISLEKIYDKFIIGSFASINFDTFLLSPETPLSNHPDVTYMDSEKTLLGLRLHFRGFHHVFIDLETGLALNERLFLSNDKRDRVPGTEFDRKGFESFFTNFNLGYKF